MKSNLWAKTVLSVYKYLERITEAIDKLVEQNALNSFYYLSGSRQDNSVLKVADRLIELQERKIKLINLNVLVEDSLKKCDKLSAQILVEKYIDNDSSENIASFHNLSMRTYFRRLNQAEDSFTSIMAVLGFNEAKLNKYLSSEKWIIDVYESLEKSNKDEDESEIVEDYINHF